MKSRAWLLYLGGGIAALLGFLSLPHLRQGWFFNLISLSSPVAIVSRATGFWKSISRAISGCSRISRGRRMSAWTIRVPGESARIARPCATTWPS